MSIVIYLLPVLLIILFLYCIIKKIPAYDFFIKGAGSAFNICINIFPYLLAIFLAVELLKISGLSNLIAKWLSPVFSFVGIPKELTELIILRPFTGSGSLALVNEIYMVHGPDSYPARCASVIMGASDTIFYVTAVYFGTTKVKKLLYTVPVALIANLFGTVLACFLCRIM